MPDDQRPEGLGALLRAWRERALLTQEQLAQRAGVDARTIRRLERDVVQRPRNASILQLATALGLNEQERAIFTAAAQGTPAPLTAPRQLPAEPRYFTGRDLELAVLDASTTQICVLTGAGGIGKTWLALHWAHQRLDRFPDGQLFADLRGFSPDSRPLAATSVLRGFLGALGVPSEQLPADVHAQAALYRSLVAGRRMLVVLDNAADTDQVVPLLPGSASCGVLVTSRSRLSGLLIAYGARPLALRMISDAEARELLVIRLGAERLAEDPEAVAELLTRCGGLPLALSIVAGRPGLSLTALVAELRETGLSGFAEGDRATSLPAVLSWSYDRLTEAQAHALALLSLAPGTDLAPYGAANLLGSTTAETTTLLRELEHASLVERDEQGRYRMHDLIRQHAAERAKAELRADERDAALMRLADFYVRTAHEADWLLDPHMPRPLAPPASKSRPYPLADEEAAMEWLDAEYANLLDSQQDAAERGWHEHVWHLAFALGTFQARRGLLHDRLDAWLTGLEAAAHLPLDAGVAAHRYLGRAYGDLGLLEEATEQLHRGVTLAEQAGDLRQQAQTLGRLAHTWERRGDHGKAMHYAGRALDLFRRLDLPVWEAAALNAVGWHAAHLGDHGEARRHCAAALELYQRHHDPAGEAATLDSLGWIDHHTGRHHDAISHYQRALELRRQLGDHYEAAESLDGLGYPHAALGQHAEARAAWCEAEALYRSQHRIAQADRLRRELQLLTEC
ncbi:tetratricopeptide repeat protein [Nonomuraea sp. NPDC049725]|uniref:ATP-binding protein n=1 Tax=Nonomuraea sp. NPDC049725 TaxID=3154508 RepID=UPI00341EC818